MFGMPHIPQVDAISRWNGLSYDYYDYKSAAISTQFSKKLKEKSDYISYLNIIVVTKGEQI